MRLQLVDLLLLNLNFVLLQSHSQELKYANIVALFANMFDITLKGDMAFTACK